MERANGYGESTETGRQGPWSCWLRCFAFPLALALICTGIVGGSSPCGAAANEAASRKHITVGGSDNLPPYEFLGEHGEANGFNVELTRAIARVLGMDVTIRLGPWGDMRGALESGAVDMVIGMFYSIERDKRLDFSQPHTIVSHAIFTREGNQGITSSEDLYNKEILVMRGDIMHDYVLENGLTDHPIVVETHEEALQLLAQGKHDCALLARLPGIHWMNRLGLNNLRTVGPPVRPSAFCYAATHKNGELLTRFGEGLAILHETGEYGEIYRKWLGVLEHRHPLPNPFILKYAAAGLIILAFLLTATTTWMWSLRRLVTQRTRALQGEIKERRQAEARLRQSEQCQKAILNNIPDIAWLKDREGRFIAVNEPFGQVCGLSARELVGKTDADVWPKELAQRYRADDREVMEAGLPKRVEEPLIHKDRREAFIETIKAPVFNDRGQVIGTTGIARDITERKRAEEVLQLARHELEQRVAERTKELLEANKCLAVEMAERIEAEEALRRSEEQMRLAVQRVPVMLNAFDERGNMIVWNEECERVTGYKADEVLGNAEVWEMLYPGQAYREGMLEEFSRRFGSHRDWEWELTCKDGSRKMIAWSSVSATHPIPGWHTWGIGVDVTERRQFMEALKESEVKARDAYCELNQIFHSTANAMLVLDRQCTILKVNDTFLRLTHAQGDQVIGRKCYEVFPTPSCHTAGCHMARILGGALRVENQIEKRLQDGSTVFLHQMATPLHDPQGTLIGLVMCISDITALKRAEEAARQQQEELFQAAKMVSLGTLVSGVAHEISNPNSFIMLNVPPVLKAWEDAIPLLDHYYAENGDFILGGLNYSEVREDVPALLSGIADGSRRIQRIVQDLKDFARPEPAGTLELVDINAVVRSAVGLLDNLLRKSTRHFSVDYGTGIPWLRGSFQRLEQVVINLVQNAAQALTDPGQHVRVATWYDDQADSAVIRIEDEGVGIPPETHTRIMDPFYTTRRGSGGTGLGLSVSQAIVKDHGGRIAVQSREGSGASFTVTLPLSPGRPHPQILVVEDDDSVREMLVQKLKTEHKYLVEGVSNGIEACIRIGEAPPDLIVLDVRLPDMDGVEVCQKISADRDLAGIRVILITGFPDSSEVRTLVEMGYATPCAKPVNLAAFARMVRDILEGEPQ